MERYTVSFCRSRRVPLPTRVRLAMAGSLALHAAAALLITCIARRPPLPVAPAQEVVAIVFASAVPVPAEDAQQPSEPPFPPEPQQVVLPPSDVPPAPIVESPPSPQPDAAPPPPARSEPITEAPPASQPDVVLPPPDVPPEPKLEPQRPTKPIPRPPSPRTVVRPRAIPAVPAPTPTTEASAATPPALPVIQPRQTTIISPGWQSALGAWLQANKTYPDEARRRGEEGRAAVRFTVSRDGRVVDFQLLRSTGSTILDAAVERLLRGARLPPFPSGMDQEQVTVTLQIRYALER